MMASFKHVFVVSSFIFKKNMYTGGDELFTHTSTGPMNRSKHAITIKIKL